MLCPNFDADLLIVILAAELQKLWQNGLWHLVRSFGICYLTIGFWEELL